MLAKQIMNIRKKAGMTQLQLAEKLNIGPSAVGMYEQGRRTPPIEILVQMANLFNVSLDFLITGNEFRAPATEDKDASLQPCCLCKLYWVCFDNFTSKDKNYCHNVLSSTK